MAFKYDLVFINPEVVVVMVLIRWTREPETCVDSVLVLIQKRQWGLTSVA